MKIEKKRILILASALTLSLPGIGVLPTSVQAEENIEQSSATEDFYSEISNMDTYLYKNQDGTISLDELSAKNIGYSSQAIDYVRDQLETMNNLITNHGGVPSEDLTTVSVYTSTDGFTIFSGGVTKIEYGFGGQVSYYLNAQDTQTLINGIERGTEVSAVLTPIFGSVSAGFASLNTLQKWQFEAAASSGNGIVMIMTPTIDPSLSPVPTISVIPQ